MDSPTNTNGSSNKFMTIETNNEKIESSKTIDNDNDDNISINSYLNDSKSSIEKENDNVVNTDDCIIIGNNEDNKESNKNLYLVNPNFNHNLKMESTGGTHEDNNENSLSMQQSWLPSILKGESWPDQDDNFIIKDEITEEHIKDSTSLDMSNPLLSIRETVLWKNDDSAREKANWKKYKGDSFFKINNNKLKDIPINQSTIPNTFANKFNKLHNSTSNPDSPLKLFDARQNTYTKFMMNNMLNQLSPKKSTTENDDRQSIIPKVIKQSDELYNKILTNSLSNGELKSKISEKRITNNTSGKNEQLNIQDDLTSDAEEFSSFPSTTRKFVHDGDKLFENIKNGFQQKLPFKNVNISQSDYTSTEEEIEENSSHNLNNKFGDVKYNVSSNSINNSINNKDEKNERFESFSAIRNQLKSQAEAYNSEFDVSPPKLQSKYKPVDDKENLNFNNESKNNMNNNKLKRLNFIPAEEYKNKIYDKKLKKFVFKNEYDTNSSYTDSEYELLDSLSITDPDKTGNSILKNNKDNDFKNLDINNIKFNDNESNNKINNDSNETINSESNFIDKSFIISDELLVKAINETYAIDDWNLIGELDLSEFGLSQLYHLDQMTPNIWYLNASNNEIQQNFGIPKGIQVLNLSFNQFNNLSSKFDKFENLQILNLSYNKLTNLRCLKELRNLTSLDLSFNLIENIEFLENFKMLHYLNLSHNKIKGQINFRNLILWFLEDLIIDNNEINELINLSELPSLINLSANNNNIFKIEYNNSDEDIELHNKLKRLCLNNNELNEGIEINNYPRLREIQIDKSFIKDVKEVSKFIEKVTLRYNKNEEEINKLLITSLNNNNFKKLYLTGSKLSMKLPNFKDKFSSISILDLSAMNLNKIPEKFSEFFPLLIDLNLNFNKISNIENLKGLKYLKQLKLLGNNIEKIDDIINYTSNIRMVLKLIDLRVNPITDKFYPFIFYPYDDDNNNDDDDNNEEEEKEEKDLNIENDFKSFKLQEQEDIEAFSIEFSRLYEDEGLNKWEIKNRIYQKKLNKEIRNEKNEYLMELLVWFEHVKFIDGNRINKFDRHAYISKFVQTVDDRRK